MFQGLAQMGIESQLYISFYTFVEYNICIAWILVSCGLRQLHEQFRMTVLCQQRV